MGKVFLAAWSVCSIRIVTLNAAWHPRQNRDLLPLVLYAVHATQARGESLCIGHKRVPPLAIRPHSHAWVAQFVV